MTQHDPPSTQVTAAPDWSALYNSEAFRELARARARFVRWASGIVLGWFAVFLIVVGAAPELAGRPVAGGITVGFLLGLSQFVVAWVITWRYLAVSKTRFAPLEHRVLDAATDGVPTAVREVAP